MGSYGGYIVITVIEYFPDDDIELSATFTVDSMANAIGCPVELASRYIGTFNLELQRCVNTSTRKEHDPSAWQLEKLEQSALKQIK